MIIKKILNNKYYFLLSIALIIFILTTFLYEHGFFKSLFNYFTKYNEITNPIYNDSPFKGGNIFEYIDYLFSTGVYYNFDYNIIFSCTLLQITPPILASISAFIFFNYYTNIFKNVIHRKKSFKKEITLTILKNANKMALCTFIAFTIIFIFFFLLANNKFALDINDPTLIPKSFLLDIFSNSFYSNNIYLYYFIEGFIKYYLIIFIYSSMAQSLILIFDNIKIIIFLPLIYYYGLTVISYVLKTLSNNQIFDYINPVTIMANSDLEYVNSLLLISFNLIPLLIFIALLYWRNKNVEI